MIRRCKLIDNIDNIRKNTTINVYIAKYRKNSKSNNYSISLPANENESILGFIIEDLNKYKEYASAKFDPITHVDDTYEVLEDNSIKETWNIFENLLEKHVDFKDNHNIELLKNCNFDIYEMEYKEEKYFLLGKVQTSGNYFKHKWVIMSANDKIKNLNTDKWFILSNKVDFIVEKNSENLYVFIFNKKSFVEFFQYHDFMKELVKSKINEINEWEFLDSTKLIIDKIDQKNVFINLARIMIDEEYLEAVKKIQPKTLKKRLLEKCKGNFSEKDFNEDKLIVNNNTLNKIMKMISKRYRYNFFTDTAEESE